MERSPFLPLPNGMVNAQVEISPTLLTVEVISTQPSAHCPVCGNSSEAVHCRYQRTVHDVPCGGSSVVLRLGVRKFVCREFVTKLKFLQCQMFGHAQLNLLRVKARHVL